MPSDKNSSNDITIHQKYLEKIVKMQQDQEVARKQEYELLRTHLAQMNVLLDQLISVTGSGSTVAATKKYIPFQTGSQQVGQLLVKPPNQDGYPTAVDLYKINDNRVIPHMTLINDGPGDIFFINAYARDVFNTEEGHLNVNDQRELFNVFEIRLRSTLPLTTFRLIEGIFRTGSTAPQTRSNVEIRPTVQSNQILKDFTMAFDNALTSTTFQSPIIQTITVDFTTSFVRPPLPPGQTAVYVDTSTGLPMPTIIPPGFQAELFGIFTNFNTDFTARGYLEFFPGTSIYIPTVIEPCTPRGIHINEALNLSFFSSAGIDPNGAPPPGRGFIVAVTNDDPFNNMIGVSDLLIILSRVS